MTAGVSPGNHSQGKEGSISRLSASAESRSAVAANAHRAQREEGDRIIRNALATLVLPPGLPCLAGAGASSDLASRPAPGLVKAWCLLLIGEVLSRLHASASLPARLRAIAGGFATSHLRSPFWALRGPSTARGACDQ